MKIGHITVDESEFSFDFARSPGAGGQNVNKVNSKAILKWNVHESPSLPEAFRKRFLAKWGNRISGNGELVLSSSRFRDQPRNKADVREKLIEMIRAVLTPPKARKETRPTRASQEKRIQNKKARSEVKSTRGKVRW